MRVGLAYASHQYGGERLKMRVFRGSRNKQSLTAATTIPGLTARTMVTATATGRE
jgi:hypothetical protein